MKLTIQPNRKCTEYPSRSSVIGVGKFADSLVGFLAYAPAVDADRNAESLAYCFGHKV